MLDRINSAFRSLIKRIRRRFPYSPVKYVKVVEAHKSGYPHLHVALQSPYIPQRWLSTAWRILTGDPVLDIRAIGRKKGAAKYLAKYLTKQTEAISGRRRWSSSPQFLPQLIHQLTGPAAIMDSWYHSGATLAEMELMLVEAGYAFDSGEHWVKYPYDGWFQEVDIGRDGNGGLRGERGG